jgi:hypothetical protein
VLKGRVPDRNIQPLASVIVAVVDARPGDTFWNGGRDVAVSAPGARVLLFIAKRNGKPGAEAETDSERAETY